MIVQLARGTRQQANVLRKSEKSKATGKKPAQKAAPKQQEGKGKAKKAQQTMSFGQMICYEYIQLYTYPYY